MNPFTSVTGIEPIFIGFWDTVLTFGTHRLTHSFTDGQTRIQHASGTVFQRWRNTMSQKPMKGISPNFGLRCIWVR